ncbi:MAG TPA: DUF4397 domain-containing protein [Burkholderiaceae bacterium]|nr:DUF4397 domain-containing protein [Burkholderiaceae bacterium]
MKILNKLLLASIPFLGLAACGGSDSEDRLDVADPDARFVHAAPQAPAVTLYRGDTPQPDATNVTFPYASNYFDVSTANANWTLKTAAGGATVGSVELNPARGTKYTFVAIPGATAAAAPSLITYADPYNKSLTSTKARVRVLNASPATPALDVYMTAPGTDFSGFTPVISGTPYRAVGPASGNDSVELDAGTYRMTVTLAGTRTVVTSGRLELGRNEDVLLITVPNAAVPGATRTLVKVEGTAGLTDLPAS